LILITIVTALGPVAGILVIHRNNLLELVVPPNVTEILSGAFLTDGFEPPGFVGSSYNAASRTVTLTFNFTNPFDFDMTINSMTANIECAADGFLLGDAALQVKVSLPAGETAPITVAGTWTAAAIDHFQTVHPSAESVDVNLVGLVVDLAGIIVQVNEPVLVRNVPIP
jgi:hypothetical protein